MPLNIWRANKGKPAAAMDRRKVLAAMADAALEKRLCKCGFDDEVRERDMTEEGCVWKSKGSTYNMRYVSIR